MLVPESFLSDDFSNQGDIEEINHMFNLIVQFSLPADAFKEYGVTSFRTKAMILQKKSQYVTERTIHYRVGSSEAATGNLSNLCVACSSGTEKAYCQDLF